MKSHGGKTSHFTRTGGLRVLNPNVAESWSKDLLRFGNATIQLESAKAMGGGQKCSLQATKLPILMTTVEELSSMESLCLTKRAGHR